MSTAFVVARATTTQRPADRRAGLPVVRRLGVVDQVPEVRVRAERVAHDRRALGRRRVVLLEVDRDVTALAGLDVLDAEADEPVARVRRPRSCTSTTAPSPSPWGGASRAPAPSARTAPCCRGCRWRPCRRRPLPDRCRRFASTALRSRRRRSSRTPGAGPLPVSAKKLSVPSSVIGDEKSGTGLVSALLPCSGMLAEAPHREALPEQVLVGTAEAAPGRRRASRRAPGSSSCCAA